MKMKCLKVRARAAGVTQDQLDDADDEDDAKGVIIKLVLRHEASNATEPVDPAGSEAQAAQVARIAALREELAGMKMKPLKVRALEAGVTQDQLDVADDEDDAKGVIVELVLQHAAFATEAAAAHVGIAGM